MKANSARALSKATQKLLEFGLNFSIETIGQRRHRWALANLGSDCKLKSWLTLSELLPGMSWWDPGENQSRKTFP